MGLREINGDCSRVLKLVVPYFLLVGLLQYAALLLLGLHFNDMGGNLSGEQTLVVMMGTAIGTFLVVGVFRKYVDKGTFASLGFESFRLADVIWGLLTGAAIMALGYLALIAAGQINYLNSSFSLAGFLINILFMLLVAFSEELLMRGYILTN